MLACMGLRERKKQETRDALSLAAIRLIVERGWNHVSVEDIAAAANVSVRTLRNYFSGKGEAVAARHVDRMRRIADGLRERPAGEPLWDAVHAAVLEQFAPDFDLDRPMPHDARYAEGVRLMLTEPALQGELAKAYTAAEAELAAAIAARTSTDVTRDLFPVLASAVLGAAIGTALTHNLRADRSLTIAGTLREALGQLTAGLPAPVTKE